MSPDRISSVLQRLEWPAIARSLSSTRKKDPEHEHRPLWDLLTPPSDRLYSCRCRSLGSEFIVPQVHSRVPATPIARYVASCESVCERATDVSQRLRPLYKVSRIQPGAFFLVLTLHATFRFLISLSYDKEDSARVVM